MQEIKTKDVSETNSPEKHGFMEIRPQREISLADEQKFAEIESNYYTSHKERIDKTPVKPEFGKWEGERGESKFVPSAETEKGQRGIEKLAEYGLDGIEFRHGEPDYSKCSEATVKIDNMTENRPSNFDQADIKLSARWNEMAKDGRTDWKQEDVEAFRHENKLSWHECCDRETMHLVSQDIHGNDTSVFPHLGGVSECKARDNSGGEFDE